MSNAEIAVSSPRIGYRVLKDLRYLTLFPNDGGSKSRVVE